MDTFELPTSNQPFPFINPTTGKKMTLFPANYSNEVNNLCKLYECNAINDLNVPGVQLTHYHRAQSFFEKRKFRKAITIFEVLKSFMKNEYLTGVHTTIAACYAGLNERENSNEYNDLIRKNLLIALDLKPTNQVALNQLYQLYYFEKNYLGLVSECLPKISEASITTQGTNGFMISNNKKALLKLIYNSIPDIKKTLNHTEVSNLLETLHNIEKDTESDEVSYIIRHLVLKISESIDEHLSYQYNLKAIDSAVTNSERAYLYNRLGLTLTNFDITEGGKKALECFYKALALTNPADKAQIEVIRSNIAMGHILDKDYQLAIDLLVPKIKKEPTNTDIFNLGRAYHLQKNYEKAEQHIQKALFISEDEITYELLADNDYCLNNYTNAIENYKHSIFFIEKNEFSNSFEDENKKFIISSIIPYHSEKILERLHSKLIQCYMETDNFKHAYYFLDKAVKRYSDKISFQQQLNILKKIIEVKDNYLELDEEFKKIDEDYKNLHIKYEKSRTISQELSITLLNIQSIFEDIDVMDINEDDFNNYQKLIGDKVIKKILEKVNTSKSNSISLSQIEKNIKEDFSFLSVKSLKFLSTAEYLYTSLKNEKIDFAPIMVEYCKVIENELIYRLFKLGIIKNKKDYSLGKLIMTLENMPTVLDTKIINSLHEVRLLRNGSAHTGETTVNKIEHIRRKYYNEEALNNIANYCERLENFFAKTTIR